VLALGGPETLLAAAAQRRDYIGGETLAVELDLDGGASSSYDYSEQTAVDGMALEIALTRSPPLR
jgi:hypothetical protein